MAANRPTQTTVLSTGSVASEVSMLFRTMRVSEIRSIESKIREDAEEKSESLRELLGTRYRDLLNAADEITAIRDASSKSVRDALRDMATSASQLREHFQQKGGRDTISPAPVTDDLERRKKVHIIGSKLKQIVDSPEVLYAHLETGDVYDAAVRYFLASRNYSELRNTPGLEGVANRFAERRWKQVHIFKEQILSAAEKKLITPGLDNSVYSNVFATLILLSEKDRDVLAVMDGMLASRTGWIDDESRNSSDNVPTRMRKVASVVRQTITCMAKMFGNSESGVEGLLREVDSAAADELKRLRDIGAVNTSCLSWIDSVKNWLKEHNKRILTSADTSRILADTMRTIDEVFSEENWEDDCLVSLNEAPTSLLEIFTPFISERAAAVASESVRRAVDNALSDIDSAWIDIGVGSDVGKLMWSVVSSQAVGWGNDSKEEHSEPSAALQHGAKDEDDVARRLVCSGEVASVIKSFESSLSESLRDVLILTQRAPSVSKAFDDSVQASLPRILESLRSHLESIPMTVSNDPAGIVQSCDHLIEQALFISRVAAALSRTECVKSAYCFYTSAVDENHFSLAIDDHMAACNKELRDFCRHASDLSASGYRTWANRVCSRLRAKLQVELINEGAMKVATGWASASGMDGKSNNTQHEVSGELRYPTTASTAAMKFLLRACRAANRAGGFALPETAVGFLREEMSRAAVSSYTKSLTFYCGNLEGKNTPSDNISSGEHERSEVAIMQMLFDVRVLQQFLEEQVTEKFAGSSEESLKAIERQLQAVIDPIDLASGKIALQEAVNGYVSRTCTLFGTITRNGLSGVSFLNRRSATTTHLASSNIVSLSRTVPRFTYLPAPMPSTYTSTGVGTAGLSAKAALGALRSEATAVNGSVYRKRDVDTSVAGYASKVSESVGRFGRGFFESLSRKVG